MARDVDHAGKHVVSSAGRVDMKLGHLSVFIAIWSWSCSSSDQQEPGDAGQIVPNGSGIVEATTDPRGRVVIQSDVFSTAIAIDVFDPQGSPSPGTVVGYHEDAADQVVLIVVPAHDGTATSLLFGRPDLLSDMSNMADDALGSAEQALILEGLLILKIVLAVREAYKGISAVHEIERFFFTDEIATSLGPALCKRGDQLVEFLMNSIRRDGAIISLGVASTASLPTDAAHVGKVLGILSEEILRMAVTETTRSILAWVADSELQSIDPDTIFIVREYDWTDRLPLVAYAGGIDIEVDATGECDDGEPCQPDCALVECGDDGCGGDCGSCAGEQDCENGLCVQGSCEPDCNNRECGADPVCNEPCGSCSGDAECQDGMCRESLSCSVDTLGEPCLNGGTCCPDMICEPDWPGTACVGEEPIVGTNYCAQYEAVVSTIDNPETCELNYSAHVGEDCFYMCLVPCENNDGCRDGYYCDRGSARSVRILGRVYNIWGSNGCLPLE